MAFEGNLPQVALPVAPTDNIWMIETRGAGYVESKPAPEKN
jgi:hypothetical protein